MARLRLQHFALFLAFVLLAPACGNEGDTSSWVLQLETGLIREAELRDGFRELSGNSFVEIGRLCDQIALDQLQDTAILATLGELGLGQSAATPMEADAEDLARAADIVREECIRRGNE